MTAKIVSGETRCRSGCGRILVTEIEWKAMPKDGRVAATRIGMRRHYGRGLCSVCYRISAKNSHAGHARTTVAGEDMLDEYALVKHLPLADAAKRIGVTKAALDQALTRAARRGDSRARRVR